MATIMAEIVNQSELCHIVNDFTRVNNGAKTVKVQVMYINKYFKDRTNASELGNKQNLYFYDLLITDGKACLRALLHPNLFHLVENNEVRKTSVCLVALNVRKIKNETHLVVVQMQLQIQTTPPVTIDSLHILTICDDSGLNHDKLARPLIGIRNYFINIWNDCLIEWPLHDPKDTPFVEYPFPVHIRNLIDKSRTTSLLDIEKAGGNAPHHLPILVRIMGITKVKRFGGVTDANECSLQAMAYVTDGTAIALVSIWNEVIASLHDKINVGTALIFNSYNLTPLKPGFNAQTKFNGVHFKNQLRLVSFEIKINPVHSALLSKIGHPIFVFDNLADVHLPYFPFYVFKFFTSFEESLRARNTNWIDVAGVVVSLSRYERCHQDDGIFVYRWIEVLYRPDQPIVRILLFVNSQLDVHRNLSLGDKIIACNLRLVEPETSGAEAFFINSQHTVIVMLTLKNQRLFVDHRTVANLYNISDVAIRKYLKFGNGFGGFYTYPLKPTKFEDPAKLVIFKGDQWYGLIDGLRFWIKRRIFAAGRIVRVEHVALQNSASQKVLYADSSVELDTFEIFGLKKPHPNTFPHRYHTNLKSRKPLQFPETSSVVSPTTNNHEDDFLNSSPSEFNIYGYYEIIIACDASSTALRCFFIPHPAKQNLPTFVQLISGEYSVAFQETPIIPRPTYSERELNTCTATARQITSMKDSAFLLDLFKHSRTECEIIFIRRFDTTDILERARAKR